MKNLRKVLFISFLALFTFIGCAQKSDNVTQTESTTAQTQEIQGNDFIDELALHDAVRAKDEAIVDELLSKGMEVNSKDKYGYTPLHLAARLDQLDIAKKLFAKGASVNNTDIYGDTPLLDSTRNSTNAMSKFLICNGAKKDVADRHEMSPLHNASKNNDLFITMLLQTKDLSVICQDLTITLEYYNETENKICGNIPTGVATNVDVTLSNEANESVNPRGPYKAEIGGKTYCAQLDKPIEKNVNYLVTAIGTNSVDRAVATANLNDLKVKKTPENNYIEGLYEALMNEFGPDFEPWNAELDKNGLVFRFKDPQVLFEVGSSNLKEKYQTILDDFFPRYLKVLNEYTDQIAAVRVEGHTSSEYKSAKTEKERYRLNKILSDNRASKVYDYTYNMNNEKVVENRPWLDKVYSHHGMSYDNLILDANGVEDKILSRRVEFRINKVMN